MRRNTINIFVKILIFIIMIFTFMQIQSYAYEEVNDSIKLASVLNTNAFEPNGLTGVD